MVMPFGITVTTGEGTEAREFLFLTRVAQRQKGGKPSSRAPHTQSLPPGLHVQEGVPFWSPRGSL